MLKDELKLKEFISRAPVGQCLENGVPRMATKVSTILHQIRQREFEEQRVYI